MSIFMIILISSCVPLVMCLFAALAVLICVVNDNDVDIPLKYAIPIFMVVWIVSIFVGIGINTNNEIVYAAKYEAQKDTIEQSLASDILTGLERIELVNKATELNGELAERRAKHGLWYYVYYDNSIYDNVEYIKLVSGE